VRQDLHLGEDLLIQLTDASQAALEGRKHFFFQEGDFLLSIGPIHPGAPQGPALETGQDFLNGMEGGFEEQEGIFLGAAKRRRRAMTTRAGRLVGRGGVKDPRLLSKGLRQAAPTHPNAGMTPILEAAPQNEEACSGAFYGGLG
jgi:hypothetical protein